MMSSSDNTKISVATTESRPPTSDVACEKERVERNRVRKGRYIESEEDESTDSTGSEGGDDLDDDDYTNDSNNVYMGARQRERLPRNLYVQTESKYRAKTLAR